MDNLFDSDNYPSREPDELVVGNRWAWTRPDITSAYPTASYTLKYRFNLLTSTGTVVEITASKVSSAHVVEVAAVTTSAYTKGDYSWQAIVVRDSDGEEVTVDKGYTVLVPDLGAGAIDTRSHNYIVLMAIRATIEGTATKDQQNYSIAGRSLSRRNLEELTKLEREYTRRWQNEIDQKRRKSGRPTHSRVLAKFRA